MARPALTDQQKRDIRRKIRAAAAELYSNGGASTLTARAVADKAGVSVGTIYSHFRDLNELAQSLWREPARRLVFELRELAEKYNDPKERLVHLLKAYVHFANSNPDVFRNAFLYVRPEKQVPPLQVSLDDDEFFRTFRQAIVDGQNQGLFREGDTNTLTQAVLSSVHGSLALPVNLHRLALRPGQEMAAFMIDATVDWLSIASG